MKAVGTKQLKNELSRYLQLVRQGEVVLVLDRDDIVAELRPPSPQARGADRWEVVMSQLEAEGKVIRATDPHGTIRDLVGKWPPVPNARAIIEDARRDRF